MVILNKDAVVAYTMLLRNGVFENVTDFSGKLLKEAPLSIVELLRGQHSGSGVSQSSFIVANFFIFTYVQFIQTDRSVFFI